MTTYRDLEFEFPDRTVLRLSTQGGAAVEFFERYDDDAQGSTEHWFSPRGDATTWEELVSRLRAVEVWTPVTPAPAGLDALKDLRGWFHAAVAEGDTEAAQAVERAAQALAVVLRIRSLSWTQVEAAKVEQDAKGLLGEVLAAESEVVARREAHQRRWTQVMTTLFRELLAAGRGLTKAA